MIWAKRNFEFADYGPYLDRLGVLQMSNPTLHDQFIMVSTTINPRSSVYYLGLPKDVYLLGFDRFQIIPESELPKEIDTVHLADQASDEFIKRFRFKASSRR